MPHFSERQRVIRFLIREIEALDHLPPVKSSGKLRLLLECRLEVVENSRYVARGPYGKSNLVGRGMERARELINQAESEFRTSFRMTREDLDNLVEMFREDPVFVSRAKRPQSGVKLQLALIIYRLAHGHESGAIGRAFRCSSKCQFWFCVHRRLSI
jgi:hypothetical protein